MLDVQNLSASYGKHRALAGVSLRVKPGEIVVILGANGAGKSTLLKAVAGICEGQVSGQASIGGEALIGLAPHKVVEAGLALVPEGRGVFGELTVRENLMLGANPKRARDEVEATLERILRLFPKLETRAAQIVRTMSGGEQQMVAIGRAMMSNPEILMLDEPSLGLSPLLSKELFASLSAVRKAGLGILLVEQNARLSLKIADRGYLLENGSILREATAAALRDDPAVQAAYLGGASGGSAPVAAAPVAVSAPVPVTPRAKPLRSISASEISGLDIGALVRDAAQKGAHVPVAAIKPGQMQATIEARPAAIQSALDAIETAARQSRATPRGALPPLRGTARPATTTTTQVVADPASAPEPLTGGKVEIWRRRPGTSQFDRTEV